MAKETVLNKENNTLSYKTTHFSTYLVVDQQKWYDLWSNCISYNRDNENPSAPVPYYDICYVIDRSGSMQGSSMTTAKEALGHFIDAMHTHDRGAIVGFDSNASVYSYFNSGKEVLKNSISSISATGGTSVEAGLVKALDVFDTAPPYDVDGRQNSKLIVLLCDGDVYYTADTLKSIKDNYIKVYPVLIGSTWGQASLETLANETGGTFYYAATAEEIREAIWGVQEEIIGEIDTTDTDGDGLYDIYETAGMMLPSGQVMYSDPNLPDSDRDGLDDGKEMGKPRKKHFFTEDVVFFDYISDPNLPDTDFDNASDKEDATPTKTNKKTNYIFYEDGGDYFLELEAVDRQIRYYMRSQSVTTMAVNTIDAFKISWNNMGLDDNGKIEYQIDEVVTVFHGSPDTFWIFNHKHKPHELDLSLTLSTGIDAIRNISVSSLDKKHINTLILSSCDNGNLDFLNPIHIKTDSKTDLWSQNLAITFMKEMPDIRELIAWDGSASYISFLGLEYANDHESFRKWSMAKNGFERLATGHITYSRSGSIIDYSPKIKYEVRKVPLHDGTYGEEYFIVNLSETIR